MTANDKKLFKHIGANQKEAEIIKTEPITYFADVRMRFAKNKVAVIAIAVIILLMLGSIFVPVFYPAEYSYNTTNLFAANKAPGFVDSDGHTFLFGTDKLGRDMFARVWFGGRISFMIGFIAAIVSGIIGVIVGSISGFFGGKIDMMIMRVVDVLISIPYLIIVMLVMVALGRGIGSIIIAMCVTGWLGMARLVRGQIMSLKNEDYVLAASSLGVKPFMIMFRHLVPNAMGVIIVTLTMAIPRAIFSEAFLAFIGLGIAPPATSWGQLASLGKAVMSTKPYLLFYPAIFISVTMLCLQIIGDGLRDALDPKLRK